MKTVADEADAIAGFWAWFAAHADRLASAARATMATDLQRHPDLIAPLDWELGPDEGEGGDDRSFFALSPGGDRARVALVARVMARAPRLAGWRLLAGKPPRTWALRFIMATATGEVEIDGTQWEAVLYRTPTGAIDVVRAWDDRASPAARRLEVGLLARLVRGSRP